jgi:hypothetical protein
MPVEQPAQQLAQHQLVLVLHELAHVLLELRAPHLVGVVLLLRRDDHAPSEQVGRDVGITFAAVLGLDVQLQALVADVSVDSGEH